MATSTMQRRVSSALSVHFGKHIIRENSRPDWCLSDTFERLELDFYLPDLNVAIEVQGQQHYTFTPHFHKSYADFEAQVKRDEAKKQRCEDYGILLLEVDDELSLGDALDAIREKEHIFSLHAKKTAEYWAKWLTEFNKEVTKVWRKRQAIDPGRLGSHYSRFQGRLLKVTNEFGMSVFDNVDPEIAQSIFWHTQKLKFWNKSRKMLRRLSKRAALASAAADTNESEAS